jgi:hypothetical protein
VDTLDAIDGVTPSLPPIYMIPPFEPQTRTYILQLSFITTHLYASVVFPLGTSVTFGLDDNPSPPSSGGWSDGLPLIVGVQQFTLRPSNALTADYTISVDRRPRDVKAVRVEGWSSDETSRPVELQLFDSAGAAVPHDVVSSHHDSALVPWRVSRVRVRLTGSFDSLTLRQPGFQGLVSSGWSRWLALEEPPSTLASTSTPMSHTTNVTVFSAYDGLYVFAIQRALPGVQRIHLTVDGVTCLASSAPYLSTVLLSTFDENDPPSSSVAFKPHSQPESTHCEYDPHPMQSTSSQ